MYKWFFKNIFSKMDPERVYNIAIKILEITSRSNLAMKFMERKSPLNDRLFTTIDSLSFNNPIGVSAGFDRNGTVFPSLFSLGFGHVEIGTTIFYPQKGESHKKIWRNGKELIHTAGFSNIGVDNTLRNLIANKYKKDGIVGISIGSSAVDVLKIGGNIMDDHKVLSALFNRLKWNADYITINLSAPLEHKLSNLGKILETLSIEKDKFENKEMFHVPLFVKRRSFSPTEINEVDLLKKEIDLLMKYNFSGVIIGNSFINRYYIKDESILGGVSGPFLKEFNLSAVSHAYKHTGGEFPIIGCGGVKDAYDVENYLRCGASLVQMYSSLINNGLKMPNNILNKLLKILGKDETVENIRGSWV